MAQTKITNKSLSVNAVESVNIKDRAVASNKIAVDAVKSEHILGANVGLNKLGSDVNNYFNYVNYTLTRSLPLSGGRMSGLVTNSVIPAFHAANPSVLTTGIAEIKGYVDIKLNKQNCFNGTTGRFTAPVNGLYFFYFNMLNAYANVADTRIQFYVNGVGVGRSYITTKPASTWRTFYGMSVFDLNQNDYVSIWLTSLNTALFSDGTHEAFGGYLIG